jgi:hypothetical protein
MRGLADAVAGRSGDRRGVTWTFLLQLLQAVATAAACVVVVESGYRFATRHDESPPRDRSTA